MVFSDQDAYPHFVSSTPERAPYLHSTSGMSGQEFPLFVGKNLPEEQQNCTLGYDETETDNLYLIPSVRKCQ